MANELFFDQRASIHSKFSQRLMKGCISNFRGVRLGAANLKIGWIGGPYRYAVEDLELILKDLSKTVGISLLFILSWSVLVFEKFDLILSSLFP